MNKIEFSEIVYDHAISIVARQYSFDENHISEFKELLEDDIQIMMNDAWEIYKDLIRQGTTSDREALGTIKNKVSGKVLKLASVYASNLGRQHKPKIVLDLKNSFLLEK